ncbi:MAG TPA: hypothetical protein VHW67_09950 [Solirubrobacteraceae bacterium]|jgi:hypothetical protein|nr:hypothetical protein [Solirubrobacteraceae bacterium]
MRFVDLAALTVGAHASVIWEFAAGVLAVYLVAAMLVWSVSAIRRFLDA